jgi:hypothetical protein
MPNKLLTSIHEEHGIPMLDLEEYWEKAKGLARGKEAKNYWAYVNAIFQNMLKLQSTSADYPKWWKKLNKEEQEEYLKDHPNSKLQPKSDTDEHSHFFGSDSDEDEQKPKEGEDEGVSMKSLISGAYHRSKAAIHANLTKSKHEVKAVKKFLTGGTLNKEEQGHAVSFAKKAGALLIGALVVASFATPLAGYGAEVGKYFLDNYWGTSESGDEDKDPVDEFMSKFQDWLAEQDHEELMAKIKEQS